MYLDGGCDGTGSKNFSARRHTSNLNGNVLMMDWNIDYVMTTRLSNISICAFLFAGLSLRRILETVRPPLRRLHRWWEIDNKPPLQNRDTLISGVFSSPYFCFSLNHFCLCCCVQAMEEIKTEPFESHSALEIAEQLTMLDHLVFKVIPYGWVHAHKCTCMHTNTDAEIS